MYTHSSRQNQMYPFFCFPLEPQRENRAAEGTWKGALEMQAHPASQDQMPTKMIILGHSGEFKQKLGTTIRPLCYPEKAHAYKKICF